ncbi:MAG: PilX N-terminal domain-containing pilus assembly protein [Gammaproteobacteria bacterium]
MSTTSTGRHAHRGRQQAGRQRGIALVIVLWLLVLLTVIAASHARIIRTETRLASNHVETGKARSLAEAGAHHAILELLVQDQAQRWPVNGRVNHIRFEDGEVAIAIRDTRGLIDINKAQPQLLEQVLTALGMEQEQRQALVDAIIDWRDKDNLRSLKGAEDDDYQRAGLRWAARDGAFSSVEELRYVLGMSNTLFERLAPYLTVHSDQADIKLDVAPAWLVTVLSDTADTLPSSVTSQLGGLTCQITVWATSYGGSNASLDMVVRMTPQSPKPYTILSWRAPARSIDRSAG